MMNTVSETIDMLKKEGYTEDFNLSPEYIGTSSDHFKLFHDEFAIDKFYRFEGESDPDDEATVYAISSAKYNIKGILVNGAGIYTDDIADELLAALNIRKR